MTRRSRLALLSTVVAAGAVAAWILWPRPENVILITIDTMRPDRISAYGYTAHRTPNLDRLAAEGALFEKAFCDVTWTTPSMASVMTGTYATRHGLRSSFQTLKPAALTLAEILRAHQMQTAAIIASYPLHSVFGLNQGFDLYDETFSAPLAIDEQIDFGPVPRPAPVPVPPSDDTQAMRWFLMSKAQGEAYRSDDQVSDRAIAWLQNERRGPFFLWIHYFGPHEKPTGVVGLANLSKEQAIQLASYDPDVRAVDAEIGRVLATLDELGLTRNSAVIVHADHGQSLLEHDYFGHGRNVMDPTARIPLIVRAPGLVEGGRRDTKIARNIDLLPTILALLGIPNPVRGDGNDLFAPRSSNTETYIETYLSGTVLFADRVDAQTDLRVGYRRLGMRTPQWKFVINDPIPFLDKNEPLQNGVHERYYSEELFDLAADPGETVNRIFDHPEIAKNLRRRVFEHQSLGPTSSEAMPMDATTRERLEALGYLAE